MSVFLQLGLLILLCSNVQADNSAKDLLNQFFSDLKTLSADFEQTVQNSQLNATEQATGKLWIERPGKFRWNYDEPYVQEIVSNGEKLWIYDADLEQVTIKTIDKSLGNTPALLLSSDKPLSETFIIELLQKSRSLNWVELLPKDNEAGFSGIRLGFNEKYLVEMRLEDNLGQRTRIVFQNLKRNQTLDATLFVFTPPKNADVFDNSQ